MHLILDSYSHPGISLFWKRHGLRIMEQLVPNEFFFTTRDMPLEKIVEREIWSGWKKLILIGSPSSIRRGFNAIMQASDECRSTLEIGFWPLDLQELAVSISQSASNLRPVLQVFKAGHTILVDVMKVQFLAPELETNYFWNDFVINSTQTNAETTIYIDEQNSQVKGKFRCRIVFHDETLNSLTMHPGKLTRTPILKVYLKRETGLTAIDRLKQIKQWLAAEKKKIEDEMLQLRDAVATYLADLDKKHAAYLEGATMADQLVSTIDAAIKRAYEGVNRVQFEDAYFRRDIGHRALSRIAR